MCKGVPILVKQKEDFCVSDGINNNGSLSFSNDTTFYFYFS